MSYAFMVSGLLVPVIAGFLVPNPSAKAALFSMLVGGGVTLTLLILNVKLPWGLDPNVFGLSCSLITYLILQRLDKPLEIANQHL
jgi:SSS family solute:Na+ symporter